MPSPKLPPPSAPSPLDLWRQWGDRQLEAFQTASLALPGERPPLDFTLARALLLAARAAPPAGPRPPDPPPGSPFDWSLYKAQLDFDAQSAPARALACQDELWGWSKAEIRLRERAFDASDPALAPRLAQAMARLPNAPWRRWSCASPIAAALLHALDALGHREPAIANLGAASLPALMGLSGVPVAQWARAVANASRPEAFVAESSSWRDSHSSFFQDFLKQRPDAFPHLPTRSGCGEDYSKAVDVQFTAVSTPERLVRQAGLGLLDHPRLNSPPGAFAKALQTPFFNACLSQSASGLPEGFDHCWPLAYPHVASGSGRAPYDQLRAARLALASQGARSTDIHEGRPIWESFVECVSEQGSEGDFAPIDDSILELLFNTGADFRSTTLRPESRRARLAGAPERLSLADYYRLALDSHRADMALETLSPWIEKCQARAEREALEAACPEAPSRRHAPL